MRSTSSLPTLGLLVGLLVGLAVAIAAPIPAQELTIEGLAAETWAFNPFGPEDERYDKDSIMGVVLDTVTGLVWLLSGTCADLPGVSAFGAATWSEAVEAVASLEHGKCGLLDRSEPGDWRLPTVDEWAATIDRAVAIGCTFSGTGDPPSVTNMVGTGCHADGNQAFLDVQLLYWTSTMDDDNPDQAWFANLAGGFVDSQAKTTSFSVWAVRDER